MSGTETKESLEDDDTTQNNGSCSHSPIVILKDIDLYGGAIKCQLPNDFMDTSTLRPVPDNQEVWLGPNSADGCFIMELLGRQSDDDVDRSNPLAFFFHDLAQHNDVADGESLLNSSSLINYHNITYDPTEPIKVCDLIQKGQCTTTYEEKKELEGTERDDTSSTNISIHIGVGIQHVSCSTRIFVPKVSDGSSSSMELIDVKSPSWIRLELCLIRLERHDTDILFTLSTPLQHNDIVTLSNDEEAKSLENNTINDVAEQVNISERFQNIWKSFNLEDWSLFG